MEQKVLDQIHLCINELQMVKQLIDIKAADDFCSRMLGIYAMMCVDDIMKIWGHSIPRSDANYAYFKHPRMWFCLFMILSSVVLIIWMVMKVNAMGSK